MARQTGFSAKWVLVLGVLAIPPIVMLVRASGGPDAPPPGTAAATRPATGRAVAAVVGDIQTAMGDFRALMKTAAMLTDSAQRDATAPKAIPILKHLNSLVKELAGTGDQGAAVAGQIGRQFEQLLLVFGDSDAVARNQSQAADKDAAVSAAAKQNRLFADWVRNSNAADQAKTIATAEAMAKDSPTDQPLCQTLVAMSQIGAATPELRQRVMAVAAAMQTPASAELRDELAADQKVHALVDKPLVITGSTVEGKAFTTADWKGKVILVDFWATWCGPCMQELPQVKQTYADFHGKGLEIVGVSNDYDPKTLTDFVAADKAMPWPQLLDTNAAAAHEWNSTTLGLGIHKIPTILLIDKQGIVRSVDADEDMEQQIPRLLAQ